MPKYTIYFQTGASASVDVEADDYESAVDAAFDEVPRDVCAQCGGWNQPWSLDLDEWDVDEKAGYAIDGEWIEG